MKKKVYIIIAVILVLILASYFSLKSNRNEIKPPITIDDKDRDCTSDADCVFVSTKCGDCGGDVINKAYMTKYKSLFEQVCKDYKTACDFDYRPTHEIKCVDSKCRLVPKK